MARRKPILQYFGALFVIMVAQVAILPNAVAYEQTRTEVGARLRLTSLPARVRLDTPVPGLSDGGRAALLSAIASWNGRSCSSPLFVLTDEEDDVTIEIVTVAHGWKYGSVIAAHTAVDSEPYTGDIRHVVIEIDGQRKWTRDADVSPDALDLESVLLHELGHALGLDHSRNPEAIMRAGIKPGQTRRNLHEDDLSGVCNVINYSMPERLNWPGHILRMAKKSTGLFVTLCVMALGMLIVGGTSLWRIGQRLFPRKIRRSSFCRIGNPFS